MSELEDFRLYVDLREKRPDLAESLKLCWEEASKLLRHAAATNPRFASHGPDHALEVLEILSQAIEPIEATLFLSADETFILSAAALLHDIGMVGPVTPRLEEQERIRQEHHLRTQQYIRSNGRALHLPATFVEIIAEIAAAHRKVDILKDITDRPVGFRSKNVPRARLCAALLRLADECHVTADRVPQDYAVLALPPQSEIHFAGQLHVSGRRFDPATGSIEFSVDVPSEEIDGFIQSAKQKLDSEVGRLRPVFEEYSVPYVVVKWIERRDELVRKKVVLALLRKGTLGAGALAEETAEKADQVASFLRRSGEATPFRIVRNGTEATFALVETQDVFEALAEEFLCRPGRSQEGFAFINSPFCGRMLSDSYLDSLLGEKLDSAGERPLARRILRLSPRALGHAILDRHTPRVRGIAGGGGIIRSLIGDLESDFDTHPDLLLEPGLLDDAFDEGNRDRGAWERWRIRQVSEYLKAFDPKTVLEQWIVPNERERKAQPSPEEPGFSFNWCITSPKEVYCDPTLLMAASIRTGLELRLESTKSITMTTKAKGRGRPRGFPHKISAFAMKPSAQSGEPSRCLPCRLARKSKSTYRIQVPWADRGDTKEWKEPISLAFRMASEASRGRNGGALTRIHFSLSIEHDLMDCGQAALMLEAASDPKARFLLDLPNPGSGGKALPKGIRKLFRLGLGSQARGFVTRLGRLQRFLGVKIPFPLVFPPEQVIDEIRLPAKPMRREAARVYSRMREVIDRTGKLTHSPVIVEIRHGDAIIERHLLDRWPGARYPRMNIEMGSRDSQELLDRAFRDAKEDIALCVDISLSPQAALLFIKENPIDAGGRQRMHPGVLDRMRPESVADHRTEVTFRWEPATDAFWYNVTPFRCRLRAHGNDERWLIESGYFAQTGNDPKRAYLAAKEALRCKPQDAQTQVTLGWRAFLVGRMAEALEITRKATSSDSPQSRFTALINLGLFQLKSAASARARGKVELKEAEESYRSATEVLKQLDGRKALMAVDDAINDLEKFRMGLHRACEKYRRKFRMIRAGLMGKKLPG